ncbi:hypothetical protein R1sor_026687 [Riccia sorocarpa]|uniref:Reverse transcriptase domain-containing protein n=1 Tax=Riccia sorocarpa TaxID=122646 RepID=A0ABD3GE69_9MARC
MVESTADASGESPVLKGSEKSEFHKLVIKYNLADSRSLALEAWEYIYFQTIKPLGLDSFTAESLKLLWPFFQNSFHEKLLKSKKGAAFIKVDLAKAYDRLNPRYLWLVLQPVGCGQGFTLLVQGLMVGAQAIIYAQGYKSVLFSLDSGVHQGCLLAPLLYALASVPLINLFEKAVADQKLSPALVVQGFLVIVTLYADDVSLFLPWEEQAFLQSKSLLHTFCSGTNSQVNVLKTEVMPIGSAVWHTYGKHCFLDGLQHWNDIFYRDMMSLNTWGSLLVPTLLGRNFGPDPLLGYS